MYKVGDTRPIPSPDNTQLEALTILTERAHRRSRERQKVEEEVTRIVNARESTMAANQFDHVTRRQLNQMDRQLECLNNVLIGIQDEEAIDAIEEERIWTQIVQINHHTHTSYLPNPSLTMAETQPIPSPSDAQLKELAKLKERAHRRARDIELIHQEIARLVDQKEAMTAAGLHYHWFYRDQLEGMEQELVWLHQDLRDIRNEEEFDTAKEKKIWN
ncbi:hypothetical protein N7519_001547 [Penicillium mononematosum]|uniref:uncharacterized protein n=1 Tax=Penicillium mononematosum TaxID=268346 RepID=UPI002548407E|nr:uncharacterized protein N7519_001547 [Penicillium mononematosum]KAJ6191526.1 hypothetical protein N7519_001547 [Penicillium mononematosum]